MRIVQINSTCGVGSTGKICIGISKLLTAENVQNHILYSCVTSGYPLGIQCSTYGYQKLQALRSRALGNYGFNSERATQKIIRELEQIKPDIVHLHNIHGHDCDLKRLFTFFQKRRTKLVWTFHDCWAFTGYCTHFTLAKCDKWKKGCMACPQWREYSWFFDRSGKLYDAKKRLFDELDLTIVTPSSWLAELVQQSFLKAHPVQVIHNGIDLDVFSPMPSNFREKYGIGNRKLVLGVSFDWGKKKGVDVFVDLARRLPDDYQIVLVGTDDTTDRLIPESILSIRKTQAQRELAEIYSAADVFVNPTREENYPTVNMEALACGTPVITFRTGGSPEMIDDTCGIVVDCDDVDGLKNAIRYVCESKPFSSQQCVAKASSFDEKQRMTEYVELYERIITERNQRD